MEHKDFIVGKVYRNTHPNVYPKHTCQCVGHTISGVAILETQDGSVFKVGVPDNWVEVKEPREYWIVKLNPEAVGALFSSKEDMDKLFTLDYLSKWPNHEIIHVREVA